MYTGQRELAEHLYMEHSVGDCLCHLCHAEITTVRGRSYKKTMSRRLLKAYTIVIFTCIIRTCLNCPLDCPQYSVNPPDLEKVSISKKLTYDLKIGLLYCLIQRIYNKDLDVQFCKRYTIFWDHIPHII